jgi:hypothetical protein
MDALLGHGAAKRSRFSAACNNQSTSISAEIGQVIAAVKEHREEPE